MNSIYLIISTFFAWLGVLFSSMRANIAVQMVLAVSALSLIIYAFRGGDKK